MIHIADQPRSGHEGRNEHEYPVKGPCFFVIIPPCYHLHAPARHRFGTLVPSQVTGGGDSKRVYFYLDLSLFDV